MNNWGKSFFDLGHALVRKARLSNAMGVPLVFAVVVFGGSLLGYIYTGQEWFLVFITMVLLFFIFCFLWFMVKNPKMLRTEEHEETMYRISAGMGQKGEELSEEAIDRLPIVSSDEVLKIDRRRNEIEDGNG